MIAPLKRIGAYALTSGTLVMSMVTSVFANNTTDNPFGDIDINGIPGAEGEEGIKGIIVSVLETVLGFLAIVAVIVIVIAGIRLIVSQGEDDAKDKAKKTIFYALAGLVIVLLARIIVGLVSEIIVPAVNG